MLRYALPLMLAATPLAAQVADMTLDEAAAALTSAVAFEGSTMMGNEEVTGFAADVTDCRLTMTATLMEQGVAVTGEIGLPAADIDLSRLIVERDDRGDRIDMEIPIEALADRPDSVVRYVTPAGTDIYADAFDAAADGVPGFTCTPDACTVEITLDGRALPLLTTRAQADAEEIAAMVARIATLCAAG